MFGLNIYPPLGAKTLGIRMMKGKDIPSVNYLSPEIWNHIKIRDLANKNFKCLHLNSQQYKNL